MILKDEVFSFSSCGEFTGRGLEMLVRSVDDVNVEIVKCKETPALEGSFVLFPNSVRRDVPMEFSLPHGAKVRKGKKWDGKELG